MANVALNIVVGGEEKAKQAIKELNGNIKQLGTNMKSLDEVFAGNQNSYDYLSAKLKNLTEAQEAYRKKTETLPDVIEFLRGEQKKLADKTDDLKQKMEQATAAYDNAENKTAALKRAMNEATKEFNDNQKALNYARDAANDYQRQLAEAEGKVDVLGEEIRKTNGYLKEAAVSADGTATSIDRYGKEIKDAGEDTKEFGKAAEVLAQAIVASGAVQGAEKLRDAIVDTAKASIEYESAFAGVRKTVDGTAEELQTISDGIKQMSLEIPMASKELAGIAENAGQLGIATGDILNFTETIAAMSVTTNLSADEAAQSLAKFANVTNMSADNYSNLGSSIVALGNNFATTEADIVAMATRLASTGEIVGLTEPQILAVATALSSVGIEAEAGGSAFSKLLKTIESSVQAGGDAVADYAKIAGMSAEQFAEAWRQDAVAAVAEFVDGLGRLDEQGGSAITVLKDLGLNEVRLSNAVLALSTAEGLLSDALDTSNQAWAENTALADEAAVRYETTESRIQILNNAFNNLKITVGDELLKTFGGAIDGLTDLTKAADEYVKKNPEIVAGLTAVAAGVGGLAVAGTVIPLVTTLWGLLSANPAGLAVAGILALVTAVATFAATLPKTTTEIDNLADEIDALKEKTDDLRDSVGEMQNSFRDGAIAILKEGTAADEALKKVEELGSKTDLTASENAILKSSIDTLNGVIPGLNLNYTRMGDNIEDVIVNLRTLIATQKLYKESEVITEALIDAERSQTALDATEAAALEKLEKAQKALDDYQLKRKEYLEEWANGRSINEELKSPYDDEIEAAKLALADAAEIYNNASTLRRDNLERVESYSDKLNAIDAEIVEKAEAFKKAMETLKTESEDGTDEAGKAFELFKQKIVSEGNDAQQALTALNTAVEAGFNKGLVQKLYEGGSETQEIFDGIIAEFARLEGEYGKGSKEAQTFVNEWNAAWMSSAQSSEALEKQVDKLFGTTEKASEAAKTTAQNSQKAIDYIGDAIKQQAKDVKSSLDTLTKEYNNVYSSTKSALDGIGGLFGEVAFKAELSIEDMIRGLETQADYMTGYMQNIQRAAQIGLDEGLVAALSDGSDESAGYIQKIITEFNKLELEYGANSTQAQDFVTRFNEAFRGSETAKNTLATNVAEMKTDFSARKDEILKDAQTLLDNLKVYSGDSVQEVAEAVWEAVDEVEGSLGSMTEAVKEKGGEAVEAAAEVREDVDKEFEGTEEVGEEAGENYVKGLERGVLKNLDKIKEVGKKAAWTLVDSVNEQLQINSPSKVGEEQGEFYDLGIAKGILDNGYVMVDGALKAIKDLEAAAQKAARAAGESIGGTIASSAAQEAGRALREMAEKGELTYNGSTVGTAASAGIPNLSGQEAAAWNAKLKAQYNLPSNWTNQDIVDWLNGGGFMAGGSMPSVSGGSVSNIVSQATSSVKPLLSTAYIDRTPGTNSHYYDAVPSPKYNVTVNQTFNTPTATPYETKTASAEGIKAVLY